MACANKECHLYNQCQESNCVCDDDAFVDHNDYKDGYD